MLRKFFGLLALILVLGISATVAAQAVTDKANLLTAQEIKSLNEKARHIEQAHKIKIGVVFVKSIGNTDMVSASNDLVNKNFVGGQNGGIVLLVDMKQRKYEMATDMRMREIITDGSGIPHLKDCFQSELSEGNYSGAVENFIGGVDELMTYYEKNGTAYGERPEGFDPMSAGLAVVVAIFLGLLIRSALIGSMSNVHHAMEAIDYLKKETVRFSEKRDTFLFMNVERRVKSGGGSRGGGGSHGSSNGGGGGSF